MPCETWRVWICAPSVNGDVKYSNERAVHARRADPNAQVSQLPQLDTELVVVGWGGALILLRSVLIHSVDCAQLDRPELQRPRIPGKPASRPCKAPHVALARADAAITMSQVEFPVLPKRIEGDYLHSVRCQIVRRTLAIRLCH